jgi:hypothetical protein
VQNERQSLKVVDVQVQIRVVRECREDDGADRLDVTVHSWRPELSISVEGARRSHDVGGRHAKKEIGEQAAAWTVAPHGGHLLTVDLDIAYAMS